MDFFSILLYSAMVVIALIFIGLCGFVWNASKADPHEF